MPPKSPTEDSHKEPKKITTKDMIHAALKELNTRKGVSLYAIKKYIIENFQTDVVKRDFYIKKYIKKGVEEGVIVQTKGIGASGSFRLAPVKQIEKKIKKKKIVKPDKPKAEKSKKTEKEKIKENQLKATKKKEKEGTAKEKTKEIKLKEDVIKKIAEKTKKEKVTKKPINAKNLEAKAEGKNVKKSKDIIKRKSIGSIIKPPKMKPKKYD